MSGVHTVATHVYQMRPKLPPIIALQMAELVARDQFDERDRLIRLLNVRGWPATAIAVSARMTRREVVAVLRERSRQPVTEKDVEKAGTLPAPKTREQQYGGRLLKYRKDLLQGVPRDIVERLRELKPMATASTGRSQAFLEEAEEYTRLLWLLHSPKEIGGYGINKSRLAAIVDQSPTAIHYRLIRYGYLEDNSPHKHPGKIPPRQKGLHARG